MTQQWKPSGGGFSVEPLENIDSQSDLPDVSELSSSEIRAVRTGELAPDYIAPWEWDSQAEQYQYWRSVVDGFRFDIPDEEVWDSESSSQDFWESQSTFKQILASDFESDAPNSGDIGREVPEVLDVIFDNRSDWFVVDDSVDVSQTISEGLYDYSFDSKESRYVQRIDRSDEDNDIDTAITVFGPFDISDVDTLHYWMDFSKEVGSSPGMAISICEAGSTEQEMVDHIGGENDTIDESFDVSDRVGEHEIVMLTNSSGSINHTARWADIYFD